MGPRDRTTFYNGFGDGFTRAIEFVATPCLLAWLGWLVDRWAGTGAVFTVLLAAFGAAGVFARTWFAYVAAMELEEAKAPWRRT